MDVKTVRRLYDRLNTPQRGPRARDGRAVGKREVQEQLDNWLQGYTDELDD